MQHDSQRQNRGARPHRAAADNRAPTRKRPIWFDLEPDDFEVPEEADPEPGDFYIDPDDL